MGESESNGPMEVRVTRLEEEMALMRKEMSDVKIENAETKVYVKQILEQLSELKALVVNRNEVSSNPNPPVDKKSNEFVTIVITELFKLVTTAVTVLAAIAGYSKISGK